ncbi:hypothetical protein CYLTODRAFT_479014 [Cylindrobasidium torrendii FP15055 ss-10]|uniref:Uncharacterized protein n=1 Tax=Cylindrobasidium torrendii FP15055 ss-10 TaxID=1314674 RepID=A0A0D7ASJ8_9AGAR|nr:hypothetical protein CYLTODRAFT_479014 [Cylindrobasidium torrendii FP15055 ss-10]
MDHILTRCKATGQKEIWNLMKQLCRAKGINWKKPNLGDILASPLAEFKDRDGKQLNGRTRFYRLVMPQAAYVIWLARCQRTIPDDRTGELRKPMSKEEIRIRFTKALDRTL